MKISAFPLKPRWAATVAVLILAAGCRSTPPAPQTEAKEANDFPTLARVEYVLQCMQEHGGQNYNNLYHCTCAVDKIASRMSHDEFVQAQTFTFGFNVVGERGAEFRDPPESEKLREKYKEVTKYAQEACFPASAAKDANK
jgi:hypothetical protein